LLIYRLFILVQAQLTFHMEANQSTLEQQARFSKRYACAKSVAVWESTFTAAIVARNFREIERVVELVDSYLKFASLLACI